MKIEPEPVHDIVNARVLAIFGDKITTDHISPAGSIKAASPAGQYPARAAGLAAEFQPIWHAPRQS